MVIFLVKEVFFTSFFLPLCWFGGRCQGNTIAFDDAQFGNPCSGMLVMN